MKKLVIFMLILNLVLLGCGSVFAEGTVDQELKDKISKVMAEGPYPDETVKIAVEIYDPTDAGFLALKDYFNYLKKYLNVEFIYSEAIENASHELKFIENAAISGCDAVLGYYNVSKSEAVATAIDYGMYYWGLADDDAIYDPFKKDSHYLGSVNYGGGERKAGYAIGNYVIKQGARDIVYSSGGADFGVGMFVNRRKGFMDAVREARADGKEINVIDVSGFPNNDQFFSAQSDALSKDIDAVCASFNGLDFWAQPIASAGKKDEVMLATIGSINDDYVKAFEDGSVSFLASKSIQSYGFAIPMIINAIQGNAGVLKKDGLATNLALDYWLIDSTREIKKIREIQKSERVYSPEELMMIIKNINPDADRETLKTLVNNPLKKVIDVK